MQTAARAKRPARNRKGEISIRALSNEIRVVETAADGSWKIVPVRIDASAANEKEAVRIQTLSVEIEVVEIDANGSETIVRIRVVAPLRDEFETRLYDWRVLNPHLQFSPEGLGIRDDEA